MAEGQGTSLTNESEEDRRIAEWEANSAYYVPPPDNDRQHIVDVLIKERAPRLSKSRFWRIYRLILNKILGYKRAKELVDTAGRWPAGRAFAHASAILGVNLDVEGLEHIPEDGVFIIALNHPTGIADGLAVHDALAPVRDDTIVFVNGDAIRLNPLLTDKLIPVEWREDLKSRAKSRETLKASNKAFAEGRAIVLFPSGRIAYMDEDKQLQERQWQSSIAALAKKYKCPVIPANIKSRNSWLYYWFWNVNEELRDMTLFYELFNKQGKTFNLKITEAIPYQNLLEDNDEAAAELRAYVCEGIDREQTFDQWRAAGGVAETDVPPPMQD